MPVNCGAIPENLMESEFFGYKKGAFTGAGEDRDGFFQAANGGTLFLDEVADLPLPMQVKLLRAIQEKRVRKVGATQEDPVDVRIICATHQNLAALVAAGRFRQDLFYRLNVIELEMPPLRECREDIPLIAAAILARLGARAAGRRPASRRRRSRSSRATTSPATSASWRTSWSAPWRSPAPRRSAPRTCASRRSGRRGARQRQAPAAASRCPTTWTASSARRSSRRSPRPASTAPPRRSSSASPSASCATACSAWASARKSRDGMSSPAARHGWVQGARRVPSPNCDERPAGAEISLLVLHAISLPPGEYGGDAIERLFTNRLDPEAHPYFAEIAGLGVSAHFLVRRDGALLQFVPVHERAWHAGASSWRGRDRCNDFSVGIELEGSEDERFRACAIFHTRRAGALPEKRAAAARHRGAQRSRAAAARPIPARISTGRGCSPSASPT